MIGRMRREVASSLGALSEPRFRLLWIGQAVSALGDGLIGVALAFAVLKLGGSATDLGRVLAAFLSAQVTFLLVGGVWADRLPRHRVMLSSDVIRAAVQGGMGALLLSGRANLTLLTVAAILQGAASAFFQPASTGLTPQTVSPQRLQQANALLGLSRSVVSVGGPALAGLLVAVFNPGIVFVVDAASYVVSFVSLALLEIEPAEETARQSFLRELAEGWHELVIRPWYWMNLTTHAMWNFAVSAFFVLGPIICARSLGGPGAWGIISGSLALGGVVGGVIALRIVPRRPLVAANLALTITALALLALAPPMPLVVIAVASVLSFAGLSFLNEVWTATLQQLIPPAVMSRVSAYDWVISLVAMPLGYVLVGPVSARIGQPATLVGAAVLLAVPSFLIVLVPGIRAVRRLDDGTTIGPGGASARV